MSKMLGAVLAAGALLAGSVSLEQEKAPPRQMSGKQLSARLVHQPKPVYPPEAKAQGIEGVVRLEITIDQQGEVTKVDVLSGHEILAAAAVEAVRQWRYEPMEYDVLGRVDVNFRLPAKKQAAQSLAVV